MTSPRPPGRQEFHDFFQSRLTTLPSRSELIWMSNQVPVAALEAGYPLGVFPWPGDDPDLFPWVCPLRRGVLPLESVSFGRSTLRSIRKSGFQVTFDAAFTQVLQACHEAHAPESWIHPKMMDAYTSAHEAGMAHSVEVWLDDQLIGGLYGIDSGRFFSGESMFHRRSNAGKAAVQFLVDRLRVRGDSILDIQQLTPHMRALGAEAWSRDRFLKHLHNERNQRKANFF
jgi:leucyl/phenylalanyl-tRNA--protein transferase